MAGSVERGGGEGRMVKRSLAAALLVAAGVAVTFRVMGLGSAPPGLYADEASIGYNAYAISRTARDEHGALLPLYFEAFGEYKNPVFIYACVPAVSILGPEPVVLRGVAAIFGLGTCLLVGLGVLGLTRDRWWALAGFTLAGFLPWLVLPGRVAFEAGTLPFLLVLGWILWRRGVESGRLAWFLLAGLAHALAFYAYSTGRVVAPMQLIVLALVLRGKGRGWRPQVGAAGVFVLGLVPALIWSHLHPGSLGGRFADVSIFAGSEGLFGAGVRFVLNLIRYVSPAFLFTDGDPILRHHTGTGGVLFLFLIPGLLRGIAMGGRRGARPEMRALLVLCLLFPLAPSITHRSFHLLRSIHGAPFLALLALVGTREIFRGRPGRRGAKDEEEAGRPGGGSTPGAPGPGGEGEGAVGQEDGRRWALSPRLLAALLIAAATLEISHYVYDLYRKYPPRAEAYFQAGVGQTVRAARAGWDGPIYYDPAVFEDESLKPNRPEIHFLFWCALDPEVYRGEGIEAFRIFPWKEGESVPPGSRVILRDRGEETGWSLIGAIRLAKGTGRWARIFQVPGE